MVRNFFFYLLQSISLGASLYAQEKEPELRLLRELLGEKDYTFVEGAFVELTPEEF